MSSETEDEYDEFDIAPAELEGVVEEMWTETQKARSGEDIQYLFLRLEGREKPMRMAIFRQDDGRLSQWCGAARLFQYLQQHNIEVKKQADFKKVEGLNLRFVGETDNRGYTNWVPDREFTPIREKLDIEEESEFEVSEKKPEKPKAPAKKKAASKKKTEKKEKPKWTARRLQGAILATGEDGIAEADIFDKVGDKKLANELLNELMDSGAVFEQKLGHYRAVEED